jgi:hypothetical protein
MHCKLLSLASQRELQIAKLAGRSCKPACSIHQIACALSECYPGPTLRRRRRCSNTMPYDLEPAPIAVVAFGCRVSCWDRSARLPYACDAAAAAAVSCRRKRLVHDALGYPSASDSGYSHTLRATESPTRATRKVVTQAVPKTTAIALSVGARVVSAGHSCGAHVRACWLKARGPSGLVRGTLNAASAASLCGHATGLEVK